MREDAMISLVVVALDGSPAAERAVPPAEALARAVGASLILIRVLPGAGAAMMSRRRARRAHT